MRYVIILLFCSFFLSGHRGKAKQIRDNEKLYITAKLWGFLKYYHPTVAKGKLDWDQELLRILKEVEGINDKEELSAIYSEWIESLGEVKRCRKCSKDKGITYFEKNFDLSWLDDSTYFSTDLSSKLRFIEANRFFGKKRVYASLKKWTENIEIKDEHLNSKRGWSDPRYRLMILFRYWNIIEYFFPYKYALDQSWDSVLLEMVPEFLNCKSELDFHLVILKLVAKIKDGHAYFSTPLLKKYFGELKFPFFIKMIGDQAIVQRVYNDSLAQVNNLQRGDIITKIGGKTISQLYKERLPYICASNNSRSKLLFTYYHLRWGTTEKVLIEYIRGNGKPQQKVIRRYLDEKVNHSITKKAMWERLPGNIGYVRMGVLTSDSVDYMMSQLQQSKAIIFDLRSYPKGTIFQLGKYLAEIRKPYAKFIQPMLTYPGKFQYKSTNQHIPDFNNENYKGKIIVLVNEFTQSQAETTVMYFQALDHTTVIGSQTSGANGDVVKFKLFKNYETYFSGLGMFYPDGREIQRIGVVPDLEVKPTIKGIREERDEVLEKALEVVQAL